MTRTKPQTITTSSSGSFVATREPSLELLPSEEFRRAIYLEQKRTERSRRKFALMCVRCTEPTTLGRHQVLTQILTALEGATRETDIVGWYEETTTLGVVFTEIGEGDTNAKGAQQSIASRMTEAFRGVLDSSQFERLGITFHVFPDDWAEGGSDRSTKAAFYENSSRDSTIKSSLIIKRAMDIAGSAIGILLLLPLMAAIAMAVKLTSNGPILFRQHRVGRYGKRFPFLKFRSMHCANNTAVPSGIHEAIHRWEWSQPGPRGETGASFQNHERSSSYSAGPVLATHELGRTAAAFQRLLGGYVASWPKAADPLRSGLL